MKNFLFFSLIFSFQAFATDSLEAQRKHVESIIAKNQQNINKAIEVLRADQDELRSSTNANKVLEGIQNACADTDFERLITNIKKSWEYDFVKLTTMRLESSYRGGSKPSISQSEVFNLTERLNTARNIKICNYNELFNFETSEDFSYAVSGAWQNYDATLSLNDIKTKKYQKTLEHIVKKAPVKVEDKISRIGNPSSDYYFGKVSRVITYDKVFSGGYRFFHADLTNPLDIIKQAKRY